MKSRIRTSLGNDQTRLKLARAPGGGAAVSLKPATAEDQKKLKPYME